MKLKLVTALQQFKKLFRKNLIVFLGLPILVVLGSIFFFNFTPLTQKASAQTVSEIYPDTSNNIQYIVTAEFGKDRTGGDYRTLTLPSGSDCQLECINDVGCAAYTYIGNTSVCYLKNPATTPNVRNASGTKFVTGVKL